MDYSLQNIAQIGTVISTFFVAIGWWSESRKRKKDKHTASTNIWSLISVVKGIMNDLEKVIENTSKKNGNNNQSSGKQKESPSKKTCASCTEITNGCIEAHGATAILLRELFKEAANLEDKLTYTTIKKWRASGRLSSDWQQKLMMILIHTSQLKKKDIKDMPKVFSNWDDLDPEHACYSPHPHQEMTMYKKQEVSE